jgi:hypothetical protein
MCGIEARTKADFEHPSTRCGESLLAQDVEARVASHELVEKRGEDMAMVKTH